MHLRKKSSGQIALFDGMLFFTIVMISSSLLTSYSITQFSVPPDTSSTHGLHYVELAALNIARSTIRVTSYTDMTNTLVTLEDRSVSELLALQLAVLSDGALSSSFGNMNADIEQLTVRTISHDYHFALQGNYHPSDRDWNVFISQDLSNPADLGQINVKFSDLGVDTDVVVTLTKPIKSTVTDTPSRGDEAEWEEQYRKPMARPPPDMEVNDVMERIYQMHHEKKRTPKRVDLQQRVVLKVDHQDKRGTEEATWMFLMARASRTR